MPHVYFCEKRVAICSHRVLLHSAAQHVAASLRYSKRVPRKYILRQTVHVFFHVLCELVKAKAVEDVLEGKPQAYTGDRSRAHHSGGHAAFYELLDFVCLYAWAQML